MNIKFEVYAGKGKDKAKPIATHRDRVVLKINLRKTTDHITWEVWDDLTGHRIASSSPWDNDILNLEIS